MKPIVVHTALAVSMAGLDGSLIFAQENTTTTGQVAARQQVKQIHKWLSSPVGQALAPDGSLTASAWGANAVFRIVPQ
jgi:light-regulated signal transduction histidine kinase (bacteriophytochrome)